MIFDEILSDHTPPITGEHSEDKSDSLKTRREAREMFLDLMLDMVESTTPEEHMKAFRIMKLKREVDRISGKILPLSGPELFDNPEAQVVVSDAYECLNKCVELLQTFEKAHVFPETKIK